jgi:hypothetical protein
MKRGGGCLVQPKHVAFWVITTKFSVQTDRFITTCRFPRFPHIPHKKSYVIFVMIYFQPEFTLLSTYATQNRPAIIMVQMTGMNLKCGTAPNGRRNFIIILLFVRKLLDLIRYHKCIVRQKSLNKAAVANVCRLKFCWTERRKMVSSDTQLAARC